jgi:prepilin-type N-terminal cleavage/methylation domain-containing protein
MKTSRHYTSRRSLYNRHGFSLIEILVVIAIIAVLAALAGWGAFAVIGGRQARNTESTIRVLNRLLQDRWAWVIENAKKETPSTAVVSLAGGDPERSRVIWTKVRLCEAFPISYAELNPGAAGSIVNTYIPASQQKPYVAKYRSMINNYTASAGPTESAACLLMSLTVLQGNDVSINDQLKYAIADTNGDGIPELTDGWARPFAFFRFPYAWPNLQANNPGTANTRNAKYADPIDINGQLINPSWYQTQHRTTYEATFHHVKITTAAAGVPAYVVGNAFYVAPIIASAGADGQFGLTTNATGAALQDFNVSNAGQAADNIYSFNLN